MFLRKYGFRDWESVLAAIGHGGLKEGQVVNKMVEEYEKAKKKEVTDAKIMESIEGGKGAEASCDQIQERHYCKGYR